MDDSNFAAFLFEKRINLFNKEKISAAKTSQIQKAWNGKWEKSISKTINGVFSDTSASFKLSNASRTCIYAITAANTEGIELDSVLNAKKIIEKENKISLAVVASHFAYLNDAPVTVHLDIFCLDKKERKALNQREWFRITSREHTGAAAPIHFAFFWDKETQEIMDMVSPFNCDPIPFTPDLQYGSATLRELLNGKIRVYEFDNDIDSWGIKGRTQA
jgi:hypothetical protein